MYVVDFKKLNKDNKKMIFKVSGRLE